MAKTLLLADDSVTIQKVVNISFASEDVTLVTVDNGDDAIRRAAETRPDLILADVVMPGKNGYEVCEAIKANPELAHIPVLLLTGTFEAFDEERAARVGAAGHVAKPFEAQTLVERVNRLLAAAPPAAPPAAPAPVGETPLAPPEAVTTPARSQDANEDSFDFFDDDLNDLREPEPAEPASDAIRLDDSDSAFAFGDDDLTPAEPVEDDDQTPADFFVTPEREPATVDRTVAILPDEEPGLGDDFAAPAEPPPTGLSGLDPEESEFALGGGDDAGPATLDDSDDPFATLDTGSTDAEAFDFSFESAPAPPDPALDSTVLNDDADLVQATVLDPKGASGYDVSSSDLGDPFAEPAVDASASLREPAPRGAPAAPSRPASPDPSEFETSPPPGVAEAIPRPRAVEPPPVPQRPSAPPPVAAPEPPEAEFAAPEPFDADFDAAEPLDAGFAVSEADDATVTADAVLAQIAPSLREQLHDTLEKAAWESFGNLTEKIVSETVDRIEKVAWEVIPQLAETLIREEIRRLKGDDDA